MADIDIERKGGGSIWPWLLGLLALLLIGWLLWEMFDDDEPEGVLPAAGVVDTGVVGAAPPVTTDTMAGAAAMPAEVQQYVNDCAPREPGSMALDHQYTSNCIQRLVAAVDAMLRDPDLAAVNVQAQMQDARQAAQRLVETPETSTEHAGMARSAFTSVATLLGAIQDQRFPGMDAQASQLEQTAQSVDQAQQLLNQREAVQSFFRQAGDLLQGMAGGAPAAV